MKKLADTYFCTDSWRNRNYCALEALRSLLLVSSFAVLLNTGLTMSRRCILQKLRCTDTYRQAYAVRCWPFRSVLYLLQCNARSTRQFRKPDRRCLLLRYARLHGHLSFSTSSDRLGWKQLSTSFATSDWSWSEHLHRQCWWCHGQLHVF